MMPAMDVLRKRFESPDEQRSFEKGRATYHPGWKWSTHVGPTVGAALCTVEHVGLVLSGAAAVSFADGRVIELSRGTLFYIPKLGHDSWVIGEEDYVSLHFAGAEHYARAGS
jgi:hypothetical protein